MAQWGDCDFRELKRLQARLEQLENVDMDALCRQAAEEIARVLLNKVKKRTPVGVKPHMDEPRVRKVQGAERLIQCRNGVFRRQKGKSYKILTKSGEILKRYWDGYVGGQLKGAWRIGVVVHKDGRYEVEVFNGEEYASYVEYGHRQQPGRYVPALGKSLKASWVKGRFMLTISEQEVKALAPKRLERLLYDALREVFE